MTVAQVCDREYRYAVAWMVTQAIFEARAYGWPFSFLFQRP